MKLDCPYLVHAAIDWRARVAGASENGADPVDLRKEEGGRGRRRRRRKTTVGSEALKTGRKKSERD